MNLFKPSIKDDDEIEKYLQDYSQDMNLVDDSQDFVNHNNDSIIKENNKEAPVCLENDLGKAFNDEIKRKESENDFDERSSINKIFGSSEVGSIRVTVFNMVILSLASGSLSLPKYVREVSVIMSVSIIIVIGITVWWALNLLSKVCDIKKTYVCSRLVKDAYGKSFCLFFNIIFILNVFGVLILSQVIIHTLIGDTIYGLFYYQNYATFELFKQNTFWGFIGVKCAIIYGIAIFIIFPLCLIKDVSKLRIALLIGGMTIIGIIIILICEVGFYIDYYWNITYAEDKPETHLNKWNIWKGFATNLDFFHFCASVYYSYIISIGAVFNFHTIQNSEMRSLHKVVRHTIVFDILIYVPLIFVGYLTFPVNTPSLIINRDKITPEADISMSFGRIALVLTIIMILPSIYNSVRVYLFNLIWGATEVNSSCNNFILTFIVLILSCSVGILYSEISSYIKLIGGICSGVIGFIIPSLLYVRLNRYRRWHWKNITSVTICFLLAFIGFISSGKTIYDMIPSRFI